MALLVKSGVELVVLFERLHGFYLDWCDGKCIEATEETLPQKKARQLQHWGIESGQRRVDIYTGLNVMILLFELHRYGQSQKKLREEISFNPCRQCGDENFEQTRLLRIIGYSQCLGIGSFVEIVGKFLSGANLSSANLSGVNLSGANLSNANLSSANLSDANLIGANLSSANLINANLIDANLIDANLSNANLSSANLSSADLRGVNLSGADLIHAYLGGADLIHADLSGTNLSGADLIHADLSGTDLSYTDLSGVNLSGTNLSGTNLSNIKWDNKTQWSNTIGLHEARGVPEYLQQDPEFAAAVAQSEAASQQQQ